MFATSRFLIGVGLAVSLLAVQSQASAFTGAPVSMQLLVVSQDGTEPSLPLIEQNLNAIGTPYTVYIESQTPGGLTPAYLSNGSVGNFQGVILTTNQIQLSAAETTALQSYESRFGVREVIWYAIPSADLGYKPFAWGGDTSGNPIALKFAGTSSSIFNYVKRDNGVSVNWVVAFSAKIANDGTNTALLKDAAGYTYANIHNTSDGRQILSLTFDSRYYLPQYQTLAYGLINWVSGGIFLGQRHVYMCPQIDDILNPQGVWGNGDVNGGGTFRMSGNDFNLISAWQAQVRTQPTTKNLRLTWAFVAGGANPAFWDSGTSDSLLTAIKQGQADFNWVNHTYDHIGFDGASYDFTYYEIFGGYPVPGIKKFTHFSRENLVTPGTSGLTTPDAMQAAWDAGVRYIAMEPQMDGLPLPVFNGGAYNPSQPGMLMMPRYSGGPYYAVTTPAQWEDEYNYIVYPDGSSHTAEADILNTETDRLVGCMLLGDCNLWYYHQNNCLAYDGTNSLLTDTLNGVLAKYNSYYTLPVVCPTMDELGGQMANRQAYDNSGVTGTLVPGQSITVSVVNGAPIPVTGLQASGAENYGGQPISTVNLNAGGSVTLPVK